VSVFWDTVYILTTAYKTYQKQIRKQKPRRSIHTGSAALPSRAVLIDVTRREQDATNEECSTSTTRRYLYLYRHFSSCSMLAVENGHGKQQRLSLAVRLISETVRA